MVVLRLLAFVIVSVVLLPVSVIGYVAFGVTILIEARGSGASFTAYKPLGARWLFDRTGARPDPAVGPLMAALPGGRTLGLLMAPSLIAARVSGYEPFFMRYPVQLPSSVVEMFAHRTAFVDEALASALGGVEQVVVLGAGWDTRAWTLAPAAGVRVFEVDAPATQRVKRDALERAGLDLGGVTLVTVDFNTDPWIDRLLEEGFDPARRTFVVWEGVSYYLEPDAVADTLRWVRDLPAGSGIVFDYLSAEIVEGRGPLLFRPSVAMLNATGERLRFGIPDAEDAGAQLGAFVERHGLQLERHERYGGGDHAFGGVVLASSRGAAH